MSHTRPLRSLLIALTGLAWVVAFAGSPAAAVAGPGRGARLPQHADKALSLPREALLLVDQLVPDCVTVVNQASALNPNPAYSRGRPTVTGTLRMDATGRMSYRPIPFDALVFVDSSGASSRFLISTLRGDFSSGEDFLAGDHQADCTVSSGDSFKVQLQSVREGADQWQTVQGTTNVDGEEIVVDLMLRSNQATDVDIFFSQYADVVTGTIEADGLRLSVEEASTEEAFDLTSRTQFVVNSQWLEGATRYQFRNLTYSTLMNNGQPDISGYTAQGSMTANGRPIGQTEMRISPSALTLLLAGASGRAILKTWTR